MIDIESKSAIEPSDSEEDFGVAVIVDGVVVAWFIDFNDEAQQWCTENHFGKWLAWRAKPPEIVTLTDAELSEAQRFGEEFAKMLHSKPEST